MKSDAYRADDRGRNAVFPSEGGLPLGRRGAVELVAFLATNPEVGDIVPETGGVRKFRSAIEGKGKSGGVRVIYYFHNEAFPLFLLTVYGKSQKANLSKAERNDLKKLVPRLIKTYGKGKPL